MTIAKPPIEALMNTLVSWASLQNKTKKTKIELNHPISYSMVLLSQWGPTTTLNH
jgi:hypothetical protein